MLFVCVLIWICVFAGLICWFGYVWMNNSDEFDKLSGVALDLHTNCSFSFCSCFLSNGWFEMIWVSEIEHKAVFRWAENKQEKWSNLFYCLQSPTLVLRWFLLFLPTEALPRLWLWWHMAACARLSLCFDSDASRGVLREARSHLTSPEPPPRKKAPSILHKHTQTKT